jgi:hypothetical protein
MHRDMRKTGVLRQAEHAVQVLYGLASRPFDQVVYARQCDDLSGTPIVGDMNVAIIRSANILQCRWFVPHAHERFIRIAGPVHLAQFFFRDALSRTAVYCRENAAIDRKQMGRELHRIALGSERPELLFDFYGMAMRLETVGAEVVTDIGKMSDGLRCDAGPRESGFRIDDDASRIDQSRFEQWKCCKNRACGIATWIRRQT